MQIGMKCLEKEVFLCTMYYVYSPQKAISSDCTQVMYPVYTTVTIHVRTQSHKLASVGCGVHYNNKSYNIILSYTHMHANITLSCN